MTEDDRPNSRRMKRGFFILAGTFLLVLGAVGIVLPILPTTPFLLLAAACYYKGSERMHRWMLTNRWFGGYIKNYKEGRGISFRAKVFTLSLLWVVIGYSALFMVNLILVQMILLIIAVGVSIHILTRPTLKQG